MSGHPDPGPDEFGPWFEKRMKDPGFRSIYTSAEADDLIERCALAGYEAWSASLTRVDDDGDWAAVAHAVLAEAAAPQPPAAPAPITAEDVRAAERAWDALPLTEAFKYRLGQAAFVADWLNRRSER